MKGWPLQAVSLPYSFIFIGKHDTMGILHFIILDNDEKSGYTSRSFG